MPYYAQFVLINEATGCVRWHESHDNAIKERETLGGVVYNTATCDPVLLEKTLTAARYRMGVE